MAHKMSFGECLDRLLSVRGWSSVRLAREINTDPSYIRKWIRGDRVPSLQSNYVSKIAASLSKGLDLEPNPDTNSLLQQLKDMDINIDENRELDQIIETVLKERQIYSLLMKPPLRETNYLYPRREISGILKRLDIGAGINPAKSEEDAFLAEVSVIPFYLAGRESILSAVLTVLRAALNKQDNNSAEIVMTCQSEAHLFHGYDAFYKNWKALITEALDQGWLVRNLYRVNKNIDRLQKLVSEIMAWAGYKNRFLPSFFTKYGSVNPPSEVLVIGGTGGFKLYAADNDDNIDRAFFVRHEEPWESLYNHTMRMYRDTNSLLRHFPTYGEFYEFLVSQYKQPGDYFVVSLDLDTCTIPMPLWKKYLWRTITDEETRESQIRCVRKLIRIFHENLRKYKVRHICQIQALEYMLEWGDYFYTRFYKKPAFEDILEHLNYTIHLLKTYENFEIALLSENQNDLLPLNVWEVKGGNVGILTPDMTDKSSFISLGITEDTIAGAFHDYFLEIWDRISPKYRDKEFVISWLEEQVAVYEKHASKGTVIIT